jgi:hypothetical protein
LKLSLSTFRNSRTASFGTKTLKPYQGLKQNARCRFNSLAHLRGDQGTKTLKPYQGLKLTCNAVNLPVKIGTKTLKPYQGLKPGLQAQCAPSHFFGTKTLKPYQGLKLIMIPAMLCSCIARR